MPPSLEGVSVPLVDEQERRSLVKRATLVAVVVAGILVCLKFFAWWMTDSISLLSSLLDSLLDTGASFLNLLAVRHAMRPPTDNYRFGHGKAEALAALAQSGFIVTSAVLVMKEAISRFTHPEIIESTGIGVGVMVISIIMTLGLVRFQRQVIAKTESLAVSADSLHYYSDVLMNSGVIVSLVGSWYFGWLWLDPLFGLFISVYIFITAIRIVLQPLQVLMDRELPESYHDKIVDIVMTHPGVKGYHELKTRTSGLRVFIQLHLDLDKNLSLQEAHDIADGLEKKLEHLFPSAEVLIHQDPV